MWLQNIHKYFMLSFILAIHFTLTNHPNLWFVRRMVTKWMFDITTRSWIEFYNTLSKYLSRSFYLFNNYKIDYRYRSFYPFNLLMNSFIFWFFFTIFNNTYNNNSSYPLFALSYLHVESVGRRKKTPNLIGTLIEVNVRTIAHLWRLNCINEIE